MLQINEIIWLIYLIVIMHIPIIVPRQKVGMIRTYLLW